MCAHRANHQLSECLPSNNSSNSNSSSNNNAESRHAEWDYKNGSCGRASKHIEVSVAPRLKQPQTKGDCSADRDDEDA